MVVDPFDAYCECCGTSLGRRRNLDEAMGYHRSDLCFRCWDACDEDPNVGKVAHGCVGDDQEWAQPGCIPGLDAHDARCAKLRGILDGA